jgi:hypothetical protein
MEIIITENERGSKRGVSNRGGFGGFERIRFGGVCGVGWLEKICYENSMTWTIIEQCAVQKKTSRWVSREVAQVVEKESESSMDPRRRDRVVTLTRLSSRDTERV